MDHAGLQIGDVKLLVPLVVGDIAERGARILPPVEGDVGEHAGAEIIGPVELPHRARACVRAPHAGHPAAVVLGPVQTEGGRRGQIDIRLVGPVDGDAEDLSDLACRHGIELRLVQPMLTPRRLRRIAQIDDAADGSGRIDDDRIALGLGAGKACEIAFSRLKTFLGMRGRRNGRKREREEQAQKKVGDNSLGAHRWPRTQQYRHQLVTLGLPCCYGQASSLGAFFADLRRRVLDPRQSVAASIRLRQVLISLRSIFW